MKRQGYISEELSLVPITTGSLSANDAHYELLTMPIVRCSRSSRDIKIVLSIRRYTSSAIEDIFFSRRSYLHPSWKLSSYRAEGQKTIHNSEFRITLQYIGNFIAVYLEMCHPVIVSAMGFCWCAFQFARAVFLLEFA